ncbi:hypothetical protein DDE82_005391 [Stemphylium lycopersici]|nr:hypothetical protein DDE82_005391 [Stemphylium lycopersici]
MPVIEDTQVGVPPLPPLPATPPQADDLASYVPSALPQKSFQYPDSLPSVLPNCSCTYNSSGQPVRRCTSASHTPQLIVAPQQDSITQHLDVLGIGSQFDNK